ncbi:MAG: RNA methyltransferase, partial [Hyphomicrobiales bacterium]
MKENSNPASGEGPAIILCEPQLGANIGTAARAMGNFALEELRLVDPKNGWPNEHAVKAASGAYAIIDNAALFETTEQAVADLNYVVATTARRRDMNKNVLTPETLAGEMLKRISEGQKVGILFGREKYGLTNDQVALADAVVMAPVNPAFASLNLAQAVLLIGYEWFKQKADATLGRETPEEPATREGLEMRDSRPATKDELIGLFEHMERELDVGGFLLPAEKRPTMVRN